MFHNTGVTSSEQLKVIKAALPGEGEIGFLI